MGYVMIVEVLVNGQWRQQGKEASSNPSDFLGVAYRLMEEALLNKIAIRITLDTQVA